LIYVLTQLGSFIHLLICTKGVKLHNISLHFIYLYEYCFPAFLSPCTPRPRPVPPPPPTTPPFFCYCWGAWCISGHAIRMTFIKSLTWPTQRSFCRPYSMGPLSGACSIWSLIKSIAVSNLQHISSISPSSIPHPSISFLGVLNHTYYKIPNLCNILENTQQRSLNLGAEEDSTYIYTYQCPIC
jgi:hypothetical protein